MRIILAVVLLLFCVPAFAQDEQPVRFLSNEELAPHEKTINRLQDYLTKLTTIASDFTQAAPDGTLASGKFMLQRPGKMRWQYNPPTPILMVADGDALVFYDYDLEQVNYIPLDSTLIGFLAEEKIRFAGMVGIEKIEEEAGVIRISIAQKDKPKEGKLMLEFSDKPLLIRNMVITDTAGQVTSVSLNNARFGVTFDKELFIFRDPRKPKRRT